MRSIADSDLLSPSYALDAELALALFDAPHEEHCSASGAAHPSQNFAPAGLSEPHFEQRIESPGSQATGSSCITQYRERAAGHVRTGRLANGCGREIRQRTHLMGNDIGHWRRAWTRL
jgi:hypothetical protein